MLIEQKKPSSSWLPKPVARAPIIRFETLDHATFVTDHSSNTPVFVTRVTGPSGFEALIFRTALHTDLDGAPKSYAPPINFDNLRPTLPMTERLSGKWVWP